MAFIKMKASEVKELAIKRHEGYNRFIEKYVEEAMKHPYMTARDCRSQVTSYTSADQVKLGHIINMCDARPEADLYISEDEFKMLTEKQTYRGEEI